MYFEKNFFFNFLDEWNFLLKFFYSKTYCMKLIPFFVKLSCIFDIELLLFFNNTDEVG